MLGLPGGVEWIIILIIALLLFGKRLPNVMRSLGQGVKEFKRGVNTVEDEVDSIGEPEEDSSGHLPEGEYDGEYEDQYTEEGYQEYAPDAETTQEDAAAEEQTATNPAEEEADEEEEATAETEETSKPTG